MLCAMYFMWDLFVRVVWEGERMCEDSRQLKTKAVFMGSSRVSFLWSEGCALHITEMRRVRTGWRQLVFASVSWEGLTREILVRHSCLHLAWLFAFQHVQGTWYTLQDAHETFFSLQMLESSYHSLYHTTLTMKSHNKYRVQQIEYNYNQIWHGIKAN